MKMKKILAVGNGFKPFPTLLGILIMLLLGLFGGHFDMRAARALAAAENKDKNLEKKEKHLEEIYSLKEENKRLEKELNNANNLNNRLEAEAKKLYIQSQAVKDVKQELKNSEFIIDGLNKERLDLKKENESLRKENNSRAALLKKERAGFYQELGAAYGSAGNFEKAIEAYNRSLQSAPDNARIYYYLGLLYEQHLDDSRKAVYNFKKYLECNPGAADKEEVEYLIKFLSN